MNYFFVFLLIAEAWFFKSKSEISSQIQLIGGDSDGDGPEITDGEQPQSIGFSLVAYTDEARTGKVVNFQDT